MYNLTKLYSASFFRKHILKRTPAPRPGGVSGVNKRTPPGEARETAARWFTEPRAAEHLPHGCPHNTHIPLSNTHRCSFLPEPRTPPPPRATIVPRLWGSDPRSPRHTKTLPTWTTSRRWRRSGKGPTGWSTKPRTKSPARRWL